MAITTLASATTTSPSPARDSVQAVLATIQALRAPVGGCPWDLKQTHQSLRPFFIEEVYEVIDVLDRMQDAGVVNCEVKAGGGGAAGAQEASHQSAHQSARALVQDLKEELGDVLLQILLHSQLAQEAQAFDFHDVAQALNDKLVRRHPHVFANVQADNVDAALQSWEKAKGEEKKQKSGGGAATASVLAGLPAQLPALQKASRLIEKVSRVGFQWSHLQGFLGKVEEELLELKAELQKQPQGDLQAIESELGDVLFSLCNLASFLKLDPEQALRGTLRRFQSRFSFVETRLALQGKQPAESTLAEMDALWEWAKQKERVRVWGLTGGIGSGKSTVARGLQEQAAAGDGGRDGTAMAVSVAVIDADALAADLRERPGPTRDAILARFQTTEPEALRALVFLPGLEGAQNRQALEAILHPAIRAATEERITELAATHQMILYEASQLVETAQFAAFQGLIVVTATPEVRAQRVQARSLQTQKPLTEAMVAQIFQAQLSDEQRVKHATLVIDNSGSLAELRQKIDTELWPRLKA